MGICKLLPHEQQVCFGNLKRDHLEGLQKCGQTGVVALSYL